MKARIKCDNGATVYGIQHIDGKWEVVGSMTLEGCLCIDNGSGSAVVYTLDKLFHSRDEAQSDADQRNLSDEKMVNKHEN